MNEWVKKWLLLVEKVTFPISSTLIIQGVWLAYFGKIGQTHIN